MGESSLVTRTAKAAELTEEESEQLTNAAFDLERVIKARVGGAREAWWELAESLYAFHELRGWTLLGYDSLELFLAQPDVGMSRRSFFRAVQTWRDLAVTKQLPASQLKEIEPSKATQIAPAILSGSVDAEDAMDDAKELSFRDVVEKYSLAGQKRSGQKPDDSTPLDASKEPKYVRCPHCRSYVPEDTLPSQYPPAE